jgi:hypothetical protein
MHFHQTHTTTQGEKVNKTDSIVVNADGKLINAWNSMVKLTGNTNDYQVDSLYYFMSKNKDIYPEWQFEGYDKINSFGI